MLLYEFTISAEPTEPFAEVDQWAEKIMAREIIEQELQDYKCTLSLSDIKLSWNGSVHYLFNIHGVK